MAGVGRDAAGGALTELLLMMGVMVALISGARSLAEAGDDWRQRASLHHQQLWQGGHAGDRRQPDRAIWVAEGALSDNEAESRAMRGLPNSGVGWGALQPLPYGLSPTGFKELGTFDRSGLGMPVGSSHAR